MHTIDMNMEEATTTQAKGDSSLPIPQRSRRELFEDLIISLPRNNFNLPIFIYRPDIIPGNWASLDFEERTEVLQHATIELSYIEGFPAIKMDPFWEKLFWESPTSFEAFEIYLKMADVEGFRVLNHVLKHPACPPSFDAQQLQEAYTYNYWPLRVHAYDIFKIAAARKQREKRIMSMNDRHFLESEGLLNKISEYFSLRDEDGDLLWMQELNPKVALDFLDKLTKIQRVSLGLNANGNVNGTMEDLQLPKNASLEQMITTLAREILPNQQTSTGHAGNDNASLLLDNPELAAKLQELIIAVNQKGNNQ